MSLPSIVHHEYMPSTKSMAAQIYDVKAVIKRKYVETVKQGNSNLWGKVLSVEHLAAKDLSALVGLYTKDELLAIIRSIEADNRNNLKELKNRRKDLLIPELSKEVVNTFGSFLGIMDNSMYLLLQKFKGGQQVLIKDFSDKLKSIDYLLRRGYLYRSQAESGEVLVLPDELLDMVKKLNESEVSRNVKRNSDICTIGKNILYHYGVMSEWDLTRYADEQYQNYQKNRMDHKITFSELGPPGYRQSPSHQQIETVIRHYVQYSGSVKAAQFTSGYSAYYCYHSVFDPFNIYFERRRREDITYLSLSCRDLISGNLQDKQAKDAMIKYLVSQLKINSIQAHMLTEEWSCYVKNGENPAFYSENVLGSHNINSFDQMNKLLSFVSMYFMNDLNHWILKGNSPNAVRDLPARKSEMIMSKQVEVVHEAEGPGKVGRNDPCPCGSGKKFKKCCAK